MRSLAASLASLVLIVIAGMGCSDDLIEFEAGSGWDIQEPGVDAGADQTSPPVDFGLPPADVGQPPADFGLPPEDMGMDTGMPVCSLVTPEEPEGQCDLVAQDCSGNRFCSILFNPQQMSLLPTCTPGSREGDRLEGDACTGTECEWGLYCANWPAPNPQGHVCSRLCLLAGSLGCEADEVCVSLFEPLKGYGFCAPTCDPYDPNACPGDLRCSPDPKVVQDGVCEPNFRCMEYADGGDFYRGGCSLLRPDQSGCGEGLICYQTFEPRGPDGSCQKPCTSDADCAGLGTETCNPPHGFWGLQTCF